MRFVLEELKEKQAKYFENALQLCGKCMQKCVVETRLKAHLHILFLHAFSALHCVFFKKSSWLDQTGKVLRKRTAVW